MKLNDLTPAACAWLHPIQPVLDAVLNGRPVTHLEVQILHLVLWQAAPVSPVEDAVFDHVCRWRIRNQRKQFV
jgi:hypothetical protein